jgi:hypothetical protein
MRVVEVRKVFDDGRHNAFTDLTWWRGELYLAFRSATDHMSRDGRIRILRSPDGGAWEQVAALGTECDDRDPKFLTTPERLFLYSPGWLPGEGHEPELHRGTVVAASDDGASWGEFRPCGEPNVTFWRPRTFGGTHYVAAYSSATRRANMAGWRVRLLRSHDGLRWEEVSVIHRGQGANETGLSFAPDGTLTALVRRAEEPGLPAICRSSPPYEEWECALAQRFLQGPMLERIGQRLLVVGRCREGGEFRTGLFWLRDARLDLISLLPSGGDTSYAALATAGEGRWLLSYYSSHEYDTGSRGPAAIYLATLAGE